MTWGAQCDGFLAASTATDPSISAVDLPHWGTERGPDEYDWMWQKTRSMLGYVYDHFLAEFDFVLLAGDDTHVIVNNLRRQLPTLEDRQGGRHLPLYVGSACPAPGMEYIFAIGGAGYVLNRAAIQRYGDRTLDTCLAHAKGSAEDRYLGKCLWQLNVTLADTADELGRQRWHAQHPDVMATFDGKSMYFKRAYKLWATTHGWKAQADVVSRTSVSFHHLRTMVEMQRQHAILYRQCPHGSALGDLLAAMDAARGAA